jgi:hypothetical protein
LPVPGFEPWIVQFVASRYTGCKYRENNTSNLPQLLGYV